MNVKESHIVTGMSRDSSVSRQNPNLVYDAHNIRITTKDGKNSLLSVTNERGTKKISSTGDSIIGTPLGDAVVDKYIILFTHNSYAETNKDHIYRCELGDSAINITEIFNGDAGFNLAYPIETQAVYETDNIQKVYWVDGVHQPRMINIITGCRKDQSDNYIVDSLNFSRKIDLGHNWNIQKFSTGGEFPVGTIQYCFSYYTKFGQETRLVDISPMYYLATQENGLDATQISHASFNITINYPDRTFDYVRVYSIIRTTENGTPQCRIVGDFSINSNKISFTDDGIMGRTIDATSLYFIGGEELAASTLAQKDNTLFLGNIKLEKPSVGNIVVDTIDGVDYTIRDYINAYASGSMEDLNPFTTIIGTVNSSTLSYSEGSNKPTIATKYYDYNPDNNRSSYYIKRFKYLETYRLGFIAQYKNGQWSEPIWVGDVKNETPPQVYENVYSTGNFQFVPALPLITALKQAGYVRIAPVVVYPRAHERTALMQGLLCPTVYNGKDRNDNSPYAQSSWFFRLYQNTSSPYTMYNHSVIGGSDKKEGEIQCHNTGAANRFRVDGNIVTFHSPDIECVDASERTDLEGVSLRVIGYASAWQKTAGKQATDPADLAKVTDHFITTENAGIDTEWSQIIVMRRTGYNYMFASYPLYLDGLIDVFQTDVVKKVDNHYLAWVVYPWHRAGSLNNQEALTTKQMASGYNTRTALLKKNITANAYFMNSHYFAANSLPTMNKGIYTPKVFNSDQLVGVKIAAGSDSFNYYGNIDKVLTSPNGKYPICFGWKVNDMDNVDITQNSEDSMTDGNDWSSTVADIDYTGVDPVQMKYKSSPHAVLMFKGGTAYHLPMNQGDNEYLAFDNIVPSNIDGGVGSGMFIAELIRSVDENIRFGGKNESAFASNTWIRCGEASILAGLGHDEIYYKQGDCYIQRYDCLKTYAYTNEDINSVIETMSTTLETYVNLDFRYDHNRGSGNNVALSPLNFNLYNHRAYEQSGNFFSYHGLDYDTLSSEAFPNTVIWSLEKHDGEDVDNWTSIDANNSINLDGSFGKVNKLINYNNNVYCFQDIGMSQLLFNSRVQIPTSDNTPIEITNGMKMDGKRYISTKIGCTNKWSIIETPLGLYFNDDILKATYIFNGQLIDLSTTKGMKSWMNESCKRIAWNPNTFDNCRAFYDKVGRDVYWIYRDTALVYSEILGQYMSFMDYGNVPLLESLGNSTYAVTNNYSKKTTAEVKAPFRAGEVVVDTGKFTFTLNANHTKTVNFQVEWKVGTTPRNPRPAAEVYTDTSGTDDKVYVTIYTCAYYSADLYTLGDVLTAIQNSLPSFLTASLNVVGTNSLAYRNTENYENVSTYLTNSESSPFWELGTGEYNMFFGEHRPYWLTFISNSYPTENKIFNNVAWRDIVTDAGTPEPFHTFDHIRVWTENQDTRPVRFSNSLSQDSSRQPVSYDAAISNLRKKFNVWRSQIPRDKIAPNTARARISNPWCYIKLSRDDVHTERHEIMDFEVDYFM